MNMDIDTASTSPGGSLSAHDEDDEAGDGDVHNIANSGNGTLNYELDDFEKKFLHFDAEFCCKNCAISVDYLHEVVYPSHRTGIWKEIMDKEVEEAFKSSRNLAQVEQAVTARERLAARLGVDRDAASLSEQVQLQLDNDSMAASARDESFIEADRHASSRAASFRESNPPEDSVDEGCEEEEQHDGDGDGDGEHEDDDDHDGDDDDEHAYDFDDAFTDYGVGF
jgi:hypothetical protein